MVKTQTTLSWKEVDPATLQPEAARAYNECQSIEAKLRAAREKFEKLCTRGGRLTQYAPIGVLLQVRPVEHCDRFR